MITVLAYINANCSFSSLEIRKLNVPAVFLQTLIQSPAAITHILFLIAAVFKEKVIHD